MAKAAALSFTAARLGLNGVKFRTDNQTLATLLTGRNHESPRDWRIKPYIQDFINATKGRSPKVLKIDRKHNSESHALALQAYKKSVVGSRNINILCKNPDHGESCPLLDALSSVNMNTCTSLAALCY